MKRENIFDTKPALDADAAGLPSDDLGKENLGEAGDRAFVPPWRVKQAQETEEAEAPDDLQNLENPEDFEDEDDEDDEAEFSLWWAHLPDFIKPDYPLDIPPARMPFVRTVFTSVGAPRHCPAPACRRARACQGGDGPPCYRADRSDLQQALFLFWAVLFIDLPKEEYRRALRDRGNRYAPAAPGA